MYRIFESVKYKKYIQIKKQLVLFIYKFTNIKLKPGAKTTLRHDWKTWNIY